MIAIACMKYSLNIPERILSISKNVCGYMHVGGCECMQAGGCMFACEITLMRFAKTLPLEI